MAMTAKRPSVIRPTTCIGCGGELPEGRHQYCTTECAQEARRQIRARRRDIYCR